MKAIKFITLSLLTFFGVIYLLYVSYFYFNQQEMIFRASPLPATHTFSFDENCKEVYIPSYDGKKLHGLLFRSEQSKGLIFYLHGNAGNVENWGNSAQVYTDLGYDIFFLDYRGYGKSEGEVENEGQIFKDILVAYDQMAADYKNKETIVIGYSIGTGLATYLASERNPKLLILQAPFYNFLEFTDGRAPFFPDFLKKFPFKTNNYIAKVKSPVYIFHGNEDQLIPSSESERLNTIIPSKHRLFILDGEDHIGINDNADYQQKLQMILNQKL